MAAVALIYFPTALLLFRCVDPRFVDGRIQSALIDHPLAGKMEYICWCLKLQCLKINY